MPCCNRSLPVQISAYTATTAAGAGKNALLAALRAGRSALTPNDFGPSPLPTWIGRVAGLEAAPLPKALAAWECRNNRLAWLGLAGDGFIDAVHAARERYGASRIALVLGTSTSSIGATEDAYRALDAAGAFPADNRNPLVHTPHSLANFVQQALDLEGPCVTVSTACSSSAKVFASAERLLRLGLADAAVVGGVDTLCGSVLFGFNALQLVSAEPCRPFDAARSGISIGEAAGFALLERADADAGAPRLLGYGESSDAHHMSTPHPEGLGAERALDDALARAGIDAEPGRPHQPARHGEREERRGRGGAGGAPLSGAHPRDLDQGRDRPRARRRRHRRGGRLPAGDRDRLDARQ